MGKGLSDDELRALTDAEMRQSIGYWGGKLAEMRRKAEYYYLGIAKDDLAPPEIEGRSSVVSTDVRNTIESMLPQLMVKFVGGDSVVEFEPTKQEDEAKANLITDYLNYLYFKKNNGHRITYTWMKDALLQKVGIVKIWWDTRNEEKREEYKGLTDIELAQLLDDEEVEPIEQNTYPDEEDAENRQQAIEQLQQQFAMCEQSAQQGDQHAAMQCQQIQQQVQNIQSQPPVMLYDVAVKRTKTGGKLTIDNVPPEEFLISRKAKSIDDAVFVGHRVARTVSELRSMGYKNVDQISSDDQAASLNGERIERLSYDDEQAYLQIDTQSMDESQRIIWVTECYVRCDYDGDGIAELRKVVRAGNQILDNEEVDICPFVDICPIPLPHKFFGLSVADLSIEPQKVKTSLLRAMLDNEYLKVNGRYFAVEGQVNLDDLLTSRPGGVVRVKTPAAVGPLNQGSPDMAGASNMLVYMEDFLENSTGWTRYSQGNDSQSLNHTATGVNIITNRSDMRIDLIARNFADGFVKLFRLMLKLVCQHQDKEEVVRINGAWVDIDPRTWANGYDVNINVGLGTGNKDQQVQHLMTLLQVQERTHGIGISTPQNVYNATDELEKALGFKGGKFFSDPSKQPPRPPQIPPQVQIEQAKLQADQQKAAAQMQLEREKTALEQQQQQHLNELEAQRSELEAQRQAQLEALKAHNQMELEKMKLSASQEMERWKAQLDAETKILVAQISANAVANQAQVSAANSLGM